MLLCRQAIWGHIWKHTVEKSQTNATDVTLHPLRQAIWEHIWRRTVEKNQINATCVTMHPLRHIWKHTVQRLKWHMESVKSFEYSMRQIIFTGWNVNSEFPSLWTVEIKDRQKHLPLPWPVTLCGEFIRQVLYLSHLVVGNSILLALTQPLTSFVPF